MKTIEIVFRFESDVVDIPHSERLIQRQFIDCMFRFLNNNSTCVSEFQFKSEPEYTDYERRVTVKAKIKGKNDE